MLAADGQMKRQIASLQIRSSATRARESTVIILITLNGALEIDHVGSGGGHFGFDHCAGNEGHGDGYQNSDDSDYHEHLHQREAPVALDELGRSWIS